MFQALADTGDGLHADRSLRAVVLSGEGRSFCAGLDLSAMTAMADPRRRRPAGDSPVGTLGGRLPGKITNLGQQAVYTWTEMPVPVIAAVTGHAFGGGFQLALGADIRFVHPEASLSVMEVRWGHPAGHDRHPDARPPGRPRRRQGAHVHRRSGSRGAEAFELGLATHLSEDPRADALRAGPGDRRPEPRRDPRREGAARGGSRPAPGRGVPRGVRGRSGKLIGSPNQIEAVTAEMERRPPELLRARAPADRRGQAGSAEPMIDLGRRRRRGLRG